MAFRAVSIFRFIPRISDDNDSRSLPAIHVLAFDVEQAFDVLEKENLIDVDNCEEIDGDEAVRSWRRPGQAHSTRTGNPVGDGWARCADCNHEYDADGHAEACPACGSTNMHLLEWDTDMSSVDTYLEVRKFEEDSFCTAAATSEDFLRFMVGDELVDGIVSGRNGRESVEGDLEHIVSERAVAISKKETAPHVSKHVLKAVQTAVTIAADAVPRGAVISALKKDGEDPRRLAAGLYRRALAVYASDDLRQVAESIPALIDAARAEADGDLDTAGMAGHPAVVLVCKELERRCGMSESSVFSRRWEAAEILAEGGDALARESIDVQNASNLSGVARTLARRLPQIANRAAAGGVSLGSDPVLALWASKIGNLVFHEDAEGDCIRRIRLAEASQT